MPLRMPFSSERVSRALSCAFAGTCLALPAHALDKQGSAHGGQVNASESGFGVSGSVGLGVSLYNPTYAARPDNTGLALMRYLGHADVDLIGERLSIPLDVNVFSDRDRRGALIFAPTEVDVIGGLTSTWALGPGAVEFGARGELDSPVDEGSYRQGYLDARARYLFSVAQMATGLDRALGGGDIAGWATLGVFAWNPTYAARPDNSGNALLRYAVHVEASFLDQHVAVGVDGTTFTDRRTNAVRPCELDFTPELIGRLDPFELHLAYERDMPLDDLGTTPGYVQSLLYVLAMWSFDLRPASASQPTDGSEEVPTTNAPNGRAPGTAPANPVPERDFPTAAPAVTP